MSEIKYAGTPVHIGGERLLVPSLSIAQFQANYDALTAPSAGNDIESIKARFALLTPVIGQAIRRNYPEKTDEWLAGELDLISFPLALQAVQNASGLKPVEPGN